MEEFQAGNVRGELKRELAATLAPHLPLKHIEDALHSLWDFANKQLDTWRKKKTHITHKPPGGGAHAAGSTLVQCARVVSGSYIHSTKLQALAI